MVAAVRQATRAVMHMYDSCRSNPLCCSCCSHTLVVLYLLFMLQVVYEPIGVPYLARETINSLSNTPLALDGW